MKTYCSLSASPDASQMKQGLEGVRYGEVIQVEFDPAGRANNCWPTIATYVCTSLPEYPVAEIVSLQQSK